MVDSYGFRGDAYNQVIVFRDEDFFNLVLAANPNMEAIIGKDEEVKKLFPGVYIAGIKASSQRDKQAAHHISTQK